MRGEPHFIDGVPREAAAEVIVDAALANIVKAGDDGILVEIVAAAAPGAPDLLEYAGLRKFRSALYTAAEHVDFIGQALGDLIDDVGGNAFSGGWFRGLG